MISPEDLIQKLGPGTDDAACVRHLLDQVAAHKGKDAAPAPHAPPPPPDDDDDKDDAPHKATKRR